MIFLCILLWFAIGIGAFVWGWTTDDDLTLKEVPVALIGGLLGPLAIPIAFCIHGEGVVLIRKRKSKELS